MIVFVDKLGSWFVEDLHSLGSNYLPLNQQALRLPRETSHTTIRRISKVTYNGGLKKEGS